MKIEFILFCPPCYAGSPTLPPVICRSYTGRPWAGLGPKQLRAEFLVSPIIGKIDAPDFLPCGSHCAPHITVNGLPLLERAHSIFPREIEREARS